MEEIRIPLPNVKLSDIVKRKAKTTISRHLTLTDLKNSAWQDPDNWYILQGNIEEVTYEMNSPSDQLIFFSELLIYLNDVYERETQNLPPQDITVSGNIKAILAVDETIFLNIQDLQYYVHNQITNLGFNIDANSFTKEEASNLASKVDEILDKLSELQAGHEILYDRLEELKEDFKDVLTTVPLGKKTTNQRMLGILAAYFGEKGADAIYAVVASIIKEAIKNQHLLG